MFLRSTVIAALSATAALAVGGTPATTVLMQASETGIAKSAPHTDAVATAGQAAGEHAKGGAGAESVESDVTLPECPADVKNHGAYVSSVAKADHTDAEAGEHGALVSAAAQSDCGKKATDGADGDEADESADDAADASGGTHGKSGEAHGKSGDVHGKNTTHPTAPARP